VHGIDSSPVTLLRLCPLLGIWLHGSSGIARFDMSVYVQAVFDLSPLNCVTSKGGQLWNLADIG